MFNLWLKRAPLCPWAGSGHCRLLAPVIMGCHLSWQLAPEDRYCFTGDWQTQTRQRQESGRMKWGGGEGRAKRYGLAASQRQSDEGTEQLMESADRSLASCD